MKGVHQDKESWDVSPIAPFPFFIPGTLSTLWRNPNCLPFLLLTSPEAASSESKWGKGPAHWQLTEVSCASQSCRDSVCGWLWPTGQSGTPGDPEATWSPKWWQKAHTRPMENTRSSSGSSRWSWAWMTGGGGWVEAGRLWHHNPLTSGGWTFILLFVLALNIGHPCAHCSHSSTHHLIYSLARHPWNRNPENVGNWRATLGLISFSFFSFPKAKNSIGFFSCQIMA